MPKIAPELSAIEIRNKPPGLHAVGGVPGLLLRVKPTGARNWILRVTVGSLRRDVGLGGFPAITLQQAREKARAKRADIENGIDPVEVRKAARLALEASQVAAITFESAMRKCFAAKAHEFGNAKHRQQWINSLECYALPVVGKLPVGAVELAHVMRIIEPLWTEKTTTGKRVRQRIEQVLTWATVHGYRTGDNPARWKGHLDQILAKPSKIAKIKHFDALPVDAMPAFMAAVRAKEGTTARVLEFLTLTAARSGEARGALWAEVDLQARVWTVPASRMKADREHRVPLCDDAVALLESLPRQDDTDLIFPSAKSKPLVDMTLIELMRKLGFDSTVHGLRSSFRQWAAERTAYPREVAEMALAHSVGDAVERAYQRGDLIEKRARLMADWADFLCLPPASGAVVPLRAQA